MKCPKCRRENPEGAKFCSECAHSLISESTSASRAYTQPKSYTPKFLAEKILTNKSAIEGERKQVTVLFADVADYTSIAEKLDPERVHQLMDGFFKILSDKIHYHEGTINQFTGDGIMALFGAPLALENHVQKACGAALAIKEAMSEYAESVNKDFGIDFKIRMGLNSGPVVVGSIGNDLRMDYTAIGDTTNLASRMQNMAAAGTISVTQNIFKSARQHFGFTSLGKARIKGKELLHDVYRLIDKTSQRTLDSPRMIRSEMVGRESNMDKLALQVLKAKNGEGSIVNIIGDAGIGKSRLIDELKKDNRLLRETTVLQGQSISMGKNLSFHPIIDLLKRWADIEENDHGPQAAAKLQSMINKTVSSEEPNEIFPFVATMMGIPLKGDHKERVKGIEGEALENLIQKSIRDLLLKASEKSPIVVIMEDLHWADNSSIELLTKHFKLAKEISILFINVFRPHHSDTGNKVLDVLDKEFGDLYTKICIQPLKTAESNVLLDNLLKIDRLPRHVRDMIHTSSEGNPYFVEEVVRSFIDNGVVVPKNGRFTLTQKIESVVIPATIQETLMFRIDSLDEQTKSLIKTASVIGRSFHEKVLLEVVDGIDHIDDKLAFLQDVQFITERKTMGEVEYSFKHALMQETAYESILQSQKIKLHIKVAETIEKVFNERLRDFYGMLAYHYSQGEDLENAEAYLTKAGGEALKTSASSEALYYYKEAYDIYQNKHGPKTDPQKTAMFDKNIALALFNNGQLTESLDYFDKALDYYWGWLPKNKFTAALTFLSGLFHFLIALYFPSLKFKKTPTDKEKEAINLFHKKISILGVSDPIKFFFESFYLLKRVTKYDLSKFDVGILSFSDASSLFSFTGLSFRLSKKILNFVEKRMKRDDARQLIEYDAAYTMHNFLEGSWNLVSEQNDILVEKNLRQGEIYFVSQNYYWHGLSCIYKGDLASSRACVSELTKISELYEHDFSLLLKYLLKSCLLTECHMLQEAQLEIEGGIKIARSKGLELFLYDFLSYKTLIQILMGNIDDAKLTMKESDHMLTGDTITPIQLAELFRCKVELLLYEANELLHHDNIEAAMKKVQNAIKAANKLVKVSKKVALHRTDSYRLKGTCHWFLGEEKMAMKWWKMAIEEGKKGNAKLELSRAYFEMGKRHIKHDKMTEDTFKENYLQMAETLFKEMSLEHDLHKLKEVLDTQ